MTEKDADVVVHLQMDLWGANSALMMNVLFQTLAPILKISCS